MSEKRYYWLKLQKDFFKRHDIKYIESLPNGREITHFYLKLMVESVDHEGELRFSPELPYSEAMIASVTDTPSEIVEAGMAVLKELGLVKIDDEGTIILPKVVKMIDSAADTDAARRAKRYRERKKAERDETSQENVTSVTGSVTNSHESKSKSKSKSKNIKENIQEKSSHFVPPTLEEVKAYCQERNSCVDPVKFFDYFTTGNWRDARGNPVKNWKLKIITWESKNDGNSPKTTQLSPISAQKPEKPKSRYDLSDYYDEAEKLFQERGTT